MWTSEPFGNLHYIAPSTNQPELDREHLRSSALVVPQRTLGREACASVGLRTVGRVEQVVQQLRAVGVRHEADAMAANLDEQAVVDVRDDRSRGTGALAAVARDMLREDAGIVGVHRDWRAVGEREFDRIELAAGAAVSRVEHDRSGVALSSGHRRILLEWGAYDLASQRDALARATAVLSYRCQKVGDGERLDVLILSSTPHRAPSMTTRFTAMRIEPAVRALPRRITQEDNDTATAFHEAGHAVARWRLSTRGAHPGQFEHLRLVRPGGWVMSDSGHRLTCEGVFVDGPEIGFLMGGGAPFGPSAMRRCFRGSTAAVRALTAQRVNGIRIDLAVLMAGPVAEARLGRERGFYWLTEHFDAGEVANFYLNGGDGAARGDMDKAWELARELYLHPRRQRRALEAECERANEFVEDSRNWRAIEALAELLLLKRRVNYPAADRLLRRVYRAN